MDGAAPAILNAIENATGVSFNHDSVDAGSDDEIGCGRKGI